MRLISFWLFWANSYTLWKTTVSQLVGKQVYSPLCSRIHFPSALILPVELSWHMNGGLENAAFNCILLPPPAPLCIKQKQCPLASYCTLKGRHRPTAYTWMRGLHIGLHVFTHMLYLDQAGQTKTTVNDDNISFFSQVTSFSASGCNGFGPCLCWPSGPAGLHCEQMPG